MFGEHVSHDHASLFRYQGLITMAEDYDSIEFRSPDLPHTLMMTQLSS